jgi:hypothetical protein
MEEKADVFIKLSCLIKLLIIFFFIFKILTSLEQIVLPVIYAIAQNGMMGRIFVLNFKNSVL